MNEIVSMVEEEKEKGAKEVHIAVRAVFIPERIKRVVGSPYGKKARNRMQMVIDIPEYVYEHAKTYSEENRDNAIAMDAIKRGTPLPKGHGRIADMDEAIKCIKDVEGDDAIWAISLIEWACAKRTIIEADKEESEEQT